MAGAPITQGYTCFIRPFWAPKASLSSWTGLSVFAFETRHKHCLWDCSNRGQVVLHGDTGGGSLLDTAQFLSLSMCRI